jgi:hypothetical protein
MTAICIETATLLRSYLADFIAAVDNTRIAFANVWFEALEIWLELPPWVNSCRSLQCSVRHLMVSKRLISCYSLHRTIGRLRCRQADIGWNP